MSKKFEGMSVADYEEEARKTLDGDTLIYYNSGADGEATYNGNKHSCRRYRLRPRVLRGVSAVDPSSTILGHRISFPVCVSPTAWHRLADIDAEQATARGAVAAGVAMTLSSMSTTFCHDLTSSHPDGLFFMQNYPTRNKTLHRLMLCRLKELGFKAVVLTVDNLISGKRRSGIRQSTFQQRIESKEFQVINYVQDEVECQRARDMGNSEFLNYILDQVHGAPPVKLDIIQWVKTYSGLPVIVKGVLTGVAARLAAANGADAVWISNHGGRRLDFTPSTIDVLKEVVEAVEGTNAEVYIDSGFRTGADVFKALALGAQAVFIGRPVLWGLSAAGSSGVRDVLEILKKELELCMLLSGCPNIKSITHDHVIPEEEYLAAKL